MYASTRHWGRNGCAPLKVEILDASLLSLAADCQVGQSPWCPKGRTTDFNRWCRRHHDERFDVLTPRVTGKVATSENPLGLAQGAHPTHTQLHTRGIFTDAGRDASPLASCEPSTRDFTGAGDEESTSRSQLGKLILSAAELRPRCSFQISRPPRHDPRDIVTNSAPTVPITNSTISRFARFEGNPSMPAS